MRFMKHNMKMFVSAVIACILFVGSTGLSSAQTSNPSILAPVVKTTPVYSFPSLTANQLGTLVQGQTWFVLGKDYTGKWLEVQITPGSNGWAPINTFNLGKTTLSVVTPPNAMQLATVTHNTTVFADANTNSNTLGSLVAGQNWFVLTYDSTKKWVEVQITPGQNGWVYASAFNLTGALIPVSNTVNGTATNTATYHYIAYYVQAGDTLGTIAAFYGLTYTMLARVNGLANPDLIYVGQVIYIPIRNR